MNMGIPSRLIITLMVILANQKSIAANLIRNADGRNFPTNSLAYWTPEKGMVSVRNGIWTLINPGTERMNLLQRELPLQAGREYIFSGEIRSPDEISFFAGVEWLELKENEKIFKNSGQNLTATDHWQEFKVRFTYNPANSRGSLPYLILALPAPGKVEVRNLSLDLLHRKQNPSAADILPGVPDWQTDLALGRKVAIPLVAWNNYENYSDEGKWPALKDPAAFFSDMKECGITVAGFVPVELLDDIEQAGLKAYVCDPEISQWDWTNPLTPKQREKLRTLVNATRQHPAVYGYYLRDEPATALFPALGEAIEEVRNVADGLEPYINLLPDYATPEQLGIPAYRDYLTECAKVCRPEVLRYDFYSIYEYSDALHEKYWQNLAEMRAASRDSGIPFEVIVLSVAHFRFAEVSRADLSFQAWCALAYGARGIGYFTYLAPYSCNYRNSPVDQYGNKTATYDAMRNVNAGILARAEVLMRLRSDAVYHIPAAHPGMEAPPKDALITGFDHMDENTQFCIGEFTHRLTGERYVIIVNCNRKASADLWPRWRAQPDIVKLISPWLEGAELPFYGNQWIAPGDAVLLRVQFAD